MSYLSVIMIGVGLAADAFSVSVSKGLVCKFKVWKNALLCGLTFGLFQGFMPLIGWFVGSRFASIIDRYSGIIGFMILGFIGGKMIIESFHGEDSADNGDMTFKTLMILGIATSIDALAVGVTFATPDMNALSFVNAFLITLSYCSVIAVITFVLSLLGFLFGKKLNGVIGSKAGIVGGGVLCIIGLKLLIESLI